MNAISPLCLAEHYTSMHSNAAMSYGCRKIYSFGILILTDTRALLPASSLSFIMGTDEQWRKMLALMEIIWSCAMRLDVLIKLILLNNTFAFLAISTILKHRTVFIIFGSCYCVARCAHNRPYFIFCYTQKSASFVLVTSMLRFRSMHVHHRYLILAFICYFNVLIFTIFFFHIKIDL